MFGAPAQEREHRGGIVPRLRRQSAEVDAPPVDSRRSPGLEPTHLEIHFAQSFGKPCRRGIAGPATGVAGAADVDPAGQEGSHRQHHGPRGDPKAHTGDHALYPATAQQQIFDTLLQQAQPGLRFQHPTNGLAVEHPVCLRPRGTDRWSLAGIERAKVDARAVRGACHGAAERIDLPRQVTLADTADGRIAAHLPERIEIVGQQQRACAGSRRGESRLGSGVASAHHDAVELFGIVHGRSHSQGRILAVSMLQGFVSGRPVSPRGLVVWRRGAGVGVQGFAGRRRAYPCRLRESG